MLLLLMAVASIFTTAISRPTLGPPSIKLKSNISNIALMKLTSVEAEGQLSFKLVEDIHNQSANQIQIQTTEQMAQSLRLNENYIVGYMAWQTDRFTKEVSPRKGGIVLMNLPGAEPAIFNVSPELKAIFKIDVEESLQSKKEVLKIIKAGLKSHDPQARNFFVVELITRKKLLQKKHVRKLIKALLLDPSLAWKDKHFILTNNGLSDKQLGSDWYCLFAANTLNHASTQFNPSGSDSGLIVQLLEKNQQCNQSKYPVEMSRWVLSNHTGVVETAIKVMRSKDLNKAILMVEKVLNFSVLAKTKPTNFG